MPESEPKGTSLSDEQLMRLVQCGRHEALEQLYRKYGSMVRSGIARFAPGINDADIDELCQEVFFSVQQSANRYSEQQKFKSWLYGITAKKSRQWNRNKWLRFNLRDRFGTEHTAVALPVQTGHDERYEIRCAIDQALLELSSTLREPFILHASEGFSAGEIAEILGVNERAIFSRIFRAKKQLAATLEETLGFVPAEVNDEKVS